VPVEAQEEEGKGEGERMEKDGDEETGGERLAKAHEWIGYLERNEAKLEDEISNLRSEVAKLLGTRVQETFYRAGYLYGLEEAKRMKN
jgi:hypothetical protein